MTGLGIAVAVVLLLWCALLFGQFRWSPVGLYLITEKSLAPAHRPGQTLPPRPRATRLRSRLVVGGHQAIRPRWLERIVFGWSNVLVVWIMRARMLAVLKRNIEQAANAPAPPGAEPTPAERR